MRAGGQRGCQNTGLGPDTHTHTHTSASLESSPLLGKGVRGQTRSPNASRAKPGNCGWLSPCGHAGLGANEMGSTPVPAPSPPVTEDARVDDMGVRKSAIHLATSWALGGNIVVRFLFCQNSVTPFSPTCMQRKRYIQNLFIINSVNGKYKMLNVRLIFKFFFFFYPFESIYMLNLICGLA